MADAKMKGAAELFDLSGKVAIVTGGSRGMGKEMVLAFARAGADVVIASRKLDACEELATQVKAETGREALPLACHVGQWADCDALVDAAYERFGHVDVLVNNAGMSPLYDSLVDVSEELYDKVQAVNLRGPFRLSSLVATRMCEGTGGSIINVSSIAAVQPSETEIPYGLAKAGLHALTIGLSHAFAPKVRVNCIMPGPFLTDISKAWDLDAFAAAAKAHIPLQRGGEPHEIVGAALYLASEASSYTTGAILKIDGGVSYAPA
jgi:NAD(P)-dependent dehydrogenase (short-subunit alcohol dehydrogenase family)